MAKKVNFEKSKKDKEPRGMREGSKREEKMDKEENILGKEKDIFDLTFIEAIKQMMNDTEKVINLANRAVLIANRLKPDINKKCDLIELDKIDEKIKALEVSTMPAAMLMQSELSIFKNLNIDETDDIINANKNFYTVVRDSYEKYKEIMIKEMQLYKL